MGGVGKGVLVRFLTELIGERWCSNVEQEILFGTSGQSQFLDGFFEKVLVTTEEKRTGPRSTSSSRSGWPKKGLIGRGANMR